MSYFKLQSGVCHTQQTYGSLKYSQLPGNHLTKIIWTLSSAAPIKNTRPEPHHPRFVNNSPGLPGGELSMNVDEYTLHHYVYSYKYVGINLWPVAALGFTPPSSYTWCAYLCPTIHLLRAWLRMLARMLPSVRGIWPRLEGTIQYPLVGK